MNLRVAGDPDFEGQDGIPLTTTLPQAIRYAIRLAGAEGDRMHHLPDPLDPPERHFGTSLKEAEDAGVLFVKSAGNHGRDIDDDPLKTYEVVGRSSPTSLSSEGRPATAPCRLT